MEYIELDRPGDFRVHPAELTLRENDRTGSVNLSIRFVALEKYEGDDRWDMAWGTYDPRYEVWGNFNIIKKDGKLNETTVRQLMEGIGWDGDLDCLSGIKDFNPHDCQVRVKAETYEGNTSFRAGWMSSWGSTPGSGVTADRSKSLQAQHGSQLRALASNVQRDATKPNGSPPAPPAAPEAVAAPAGPPAATDEDDVPFPAQDPAPR